MRRVRGSESGPERWARATALTAQGEGGLGPGAATRTAPAPRSSPKSSRWPGSARRLQAAAPALGSGPGDQDPAGAPGEREGAGPARADGARAARPSAALGRPRLLPSGRGLHLSLPPPSPAAAAVVAAAACRSSSFDKGPPTLRLFRFLRKGRRSSRQTRNHTLWSTRRAARSRKLPASLARHHGNTAQPDPEHKRRRLLRGGGGGRAHFIARPRERTDCTASSREPGPGPARCTALATPTPHPMEPQETRDSRFSSREATKRVYCTRVTPGTGRRAGGQGWCGRGLREPAAMSQVRPTPAMVARPGDLQAPRLLRPRAHGRRSLGPLPHLPPLALQPAHSLLPPLRSHGARDPRAEGEKRQSVCCGGGRRRGRMRADGTRGAGTGPRRLTREDGVKAERPARPPYCYLMACSCRHFRRRPLCPPPRGGAGGVTDFRVPYCRKQNVWSASG
ncbi:translation initiation factor IF-2-like [Peromyscus leucopus]|uniref:translation initiation factor IF-2-like n=1 Tax=Peromyscus leucopus TaxID=10041 RepID=UPI001885014B|nr:translation initiation factor IF-2-like [Peromyscus leucopus]